jgi:hypothetical protein
VALCGDKLLVNDGLVNVLDRATRRIEARYPEGDDVARDGVPTSSFAVDGERAYASGSSTAYAFRCD